MHARCACAAPRPASQHSLTGPTLLRSQSPARPRPHPSCTTRAHPHGSQLKRRLRRYSALETRTHSQWTWDEGAFRSLQRASRVSGAWLVAGSPVRVRESEPEQPHRAAATHRQRQPPNAAASRAALLRKPTNSSFFTTGRVDVGGSPSGASVAGLASPSRTCAAPPPPPPAACSGAG